MTDENLFTLLDGGFAKASNKIAIRSSSSDLSLSYAELRRGVSRYANALVKLGSGPIKLLRII